MPDLSLAALVRPLLGIAKAILPHAKRLLAEKSAGENPFAQPLGTSPFEKDLDQTLARLGAMNEEPNRAWWQELLIRSVSLDEIVEMARHNAEEQDDKHRRFFSGEIALHMSAMELRVPLIWPWSAASPFTASGMTKRFRRLAPAPCPTGWWKI